MDLALNNLQRLISKKTQTTNQITQFQFSYAGVYFLKNGSSGLLPLFSSIWCFHSFHFSLNFQNLSREFS